MFWWIENLGFRDMYFSPTFDDKLEELPGNDLIEQSELKKLFSGQPYKLASGEELEPVSPEELAEPYKAWEYTHYLHSLPNGRGWMNETEEMLDTLVQFERGHQHLTDFFKYRASKGR